MWGSQSRIFLCSVAKACFRMTVSYQELIQNSPNFVVLYDKNRYNKAICERQESNMR